MAYLISSLLINYVFGFFLVDNLIWIISLIVPTIMIIFAFKTKKENKMANIFLIISALFSGVAFIQNFNPSYFFILMNLSALFSYIYSILPKKIIIFLAWLLNSFSIGYLITELRNLNLGIIFGIVIFVIGFREILSKSIKQQGGKK